MKLARNMFLSVMILFSGIVNAEKYDHPRSPAFDDFSGPERVEERKSSLMARLFGAAVLASIGTAVCKSELPYGLNVGLGASTILGSISLFVEKENAAALRSMAINAPVIAVLGSLVSSEKFSGKDGFLAKNAPLGINSLIRNTDHGQEPTKHALQALVIVGAYLASKTHLDRFSNWVAHKASQGYDYVTSQKA